VEAALKEAGFWREETGGRFLFDYDIGPEPDNGVWGGAAAVILTPLIDVFGANARSTIDIVAPLAPERDEAAIRQAMRGE
jgi:hypothetical protein